MDSKRYLSKELREANANFWKEKKANYYNSKAIILNLLSIYAVCLMLLCEIVGKIFYYIYNFSSSIDNWFISKTVYIIANALYLILILVLATTIQMVVTYTIGTIWATVRYFLTRN